MTQLIIVRVMTAGKSLQFIKKCLNTRDLFTYTFCYTFKSKPIPFLPRDRKQRSKIEALSKGKRDWFYFQVIFILMLRFPKTMSHFPIVVIRYHDQGNL